MRFLEQLGLIRTEPRPLLSQVFLCFLLLGTSLPSLQIRPNLFYIPAPLRQLLSGVCVCISAQSRLFKHNLVDWDTPCFPITSCSKDSLFPGLLITFCLQWSGDQLGAHRSLIASVVNGEISVPRCWEAATALLQGENPEPNGLRPFMEPGRQESICSINKW